ncbi:hypothetical protein GALMADRAFT_237994 [Galerina marginata CBS 339.88]|uniref:AA9 family lytic polysaccharide monooxygenase n=1 Tax=Galerina marginata (strain CBS 339.88) TaxID=685588 RepID=A0A067TJT4_GALM3|nr:hypothetical protein GALMADRAFT_237994 [Galerina marginata CBS 339.88]
MKLVNFISTAFFLTKSASAHSIFQEFYVNGVSQGHEVGIRVPTSNSPILDVTSNDLICNGGINPYQQPVSKTVIPVPAGAQVTAEFHHTLSSEGLTNDPDEPIATSHHGPILAYLAKVPDATQITVTGLQWFKIYQDGLNGTTWAVDKLIQNKGKVSFAIPSCIPAGQYLLRVEVIALHSAYNYPGAQFFVSLSSSSFIGALKCSPSILAGMCADSNYWRRKHHTIYHRRLPRRLQR